MTIEILPADRFTIQELTELYNQTRVDYLVPMPMNADRLSEYVHDFDVDLHHSSVARDADGQILGLCMLGFRQGAAWITRLGVLPSIRRTGAGSALMDSMLRNADTLGAKEIHLEVIKNNEPAYNLFLKTGFVETGTYLVMRHAPRRLLDPLQGTATWLDYDQALEKLKTYPGHITWINAFASMRNSARTEGLHVELPDGGSGWLVYRNTKFTLRSTLSHLIMHTEQGDPQTVGAQLLSHLHTHFPQHDTYAENIHEDDPHLPAFHARGYFTNFSRIEMRRPQK
ncbi:MAG: GNAT family N-acetyltransferase [Ignavibacteriales bacterium]|nr:GNAT family N-acetyltransferase [Ignavibacteriales bacterium]